MSDQRTRFSADFAALNAEAAVDAVRPIAMRSGQDRHRASRADTNAELGAASNEHIADAAQWVRTIRIPMWIAPGEISWPGDRNFALQQFVVGLKVVVRDRPVGSDAVLRIERENQKDGSAA